MSCRSRSRGRRISHVFWIVPAELSPSCFASLIQAGTTRRTQRIETTGKCPARVGREKIFDFAKERVRKVLQFLLPNAGNSAKLSRSRRIISRHFTERDIGEDDVGWHVAFVGEFAAQAAQALKQRFVAFDRASASLFIPRDNFNLLGESDRRTVAQGVAASRRET